MTKTKRKKRLKKIQHKKNILERQNKALLRKVKNLGFKSAQEYKLYEAIKKGGIKVHHNVHLLDEEIDLFIPPKTIIEIGYRDDKVLEKWNKFEQNGFEFYYISNIEIDNKEILSNILNKIKEKTIARAQQSK